MLLKYFDIAATAVALFTPRMRFIRQTSLPGWSILAKWGAAYPKSVVVVCGLLGFSLSGALGWMKGIPVPEVHDEFCYLLAGDTFAHGRLTNPAHPCWEHFEALHMLQQPTYMAKYPPGQGIALAIGQWLANEPIVGVWLSIGLASAAIAWMLQAWLPPPWAVLGALCATMRLAGCSWSNNYWGGAVAAAGGALLLGAVRRLADRPDWRSATILGIGLGILANSRPFEGAVISLLSAVILLVAWRRSGLIRYVST
ncbi:MAG TPA: hypothetical protein VGJ26_18305, partial [Pirellulales bacterium]